MATDERYPRCGKTPTKRDSDHSHASSNRHQLCWGVTPPPTVSAFALSSQLGWRGEHTPGFKWKSADSRLVTSRSRYYQILL